jgi:glycosyltransferase involved in cell wall biosynthesis
MLIRRIGIRLCLSLRGNMANKIALVVRGLFELSDSIGYDCIAEYRVLVASRGAHAEIRIFAEDVNPNRYPDIPVEHIARLKPWLETGKDSLIIYHWCDGWPYLDAFILSLPSRLIIRWHNNTPPWFFARYSMVPVANTIRGFNSLLRIAQATRVEFWANSVYTARQLEFLGVKTERIHVVYPLSPFLSEGQKSWPAPTRGASGSDQILKLLFVGRAVPHKGHKHLVATASMIQRVTGKKVRLTMIGRLDGSTERYVEETKALAKSLLVDAAFPGELPFSEVAGIYRDSHVFVCFSEHEGFGLPIFEAMRSCLPVVGLRSTAVGEFLRSHPLAVPSMDYGLAAARVIAASEPGVRDAVITWQHENVLRYYSQEIVADQVTAGLAGNFHWPSFGGQRSTAIEAQISALESRLEPRLREAALELQSLWELPIDSVDRLVTRYDLEAFRAVLREAADAAFFSSVMKVEFPSNRRLLGPPLRLARRLALTLQTGLIYALQRLSGDMRAEFNRIDRSLEEIRLSIHSMRPAVANGKPSARLKVSSTFGEAHEGGEAAASSLADPRRLQGAKMQARPQLRVR